MSRARIIYIETSNRNNSGRCYSKMTLCNRRGECLTVKVQSQSNARGLLRKSFDMWPSDLPFPVVERQGHQRDILKPADLSEWGEHTPKKIKMFMNRRHITSKQSQD